MLGHPGDVVHVTGCSRFAGVRRALRRIGSERTGMDSRRLDQITRSFASGMSRRGAMKGIAAALGLSAVGALRSSTEAAPTNTFGRGAYYCSEADREVYRCAIVGDSLPETARYRGEVCGFAWSDCCYDDKKACLGK